MLRRIWILCVAVALVGAACGDGADGGVMATAGPVVTDSAGTAAPTSTSEAATTAPAGEAATAAMGAAVSGTLVLLADGFQDGDSHGWEVQSGWYLFGAGTETRMAASGSAWAWWPDGVDWPAEYVLRASVRVDEGGLAVAAAVGPDGRYVVHFHENGTDLLLDQPWGTFQTLAVAPAIELGAWHTLAVGIDGAQISVFVDGEPLFAARADRLRTGSIGFGAIEGSVVAFDNVSVIVLRSQLPSLAASEPVDPGPPAAAAPVVEAPPEEEVAGEEEPPVELPEQDLYIASVWITNGWPVAGDALEVGMMVSNGGTRAVEPFEIAWESSGSACVIQVDTLPALTPRQVSCTAPGLPAGSHEWTVHVDHDDRIAEANEGNNALTGVVEIAAAPPALPDLTVVDGDIPATASTDPFRVWVVISDVNGIGFGAAHTTRFFLDGQLLCSVDKTGDFVQAFCDLPSLAEGAHLLEVVIDAEGEIAETREDNNNSTREIEVSAG